jgi:hypothetical protein
MSNLFSISTLENLKLHELKDLARKNKIKGFSKHTKKDDLVNFLFNELNTLVQREKINKEVDEIFEKIVSGKNDEADNLIDKFVSNVNIDDDCEIIDDEVNDDDCEIIDDFEIIDEIDDTKPKYYLYKFDYINDKFDINLIESLLEVKLKTGDIVQFDEYQAEGSYIVLDDTFIQISGLIADDVVIPLEISSKFDDCIDIFKNMVKYFYGIELNKDHPYIQDKFGEFECPNNWKFYYVNQDIYENEIHINIEIKEEPLRLFFSEEIKKNNYLIFKNSIEYVKRYYSLMKGNYETYGLYLTLKNKNNDNLSKKENKYIFNIKIPDYCIINIDFQNIYYEIIFTFLIQNKVEMIQFINDYYFNKKKKFVESIEPIIDE